MTNYIPTFRAVLGVALIALTGSYANGNISSKYYSSQKGIESQLRTPKLPQEPHLAPPLTKKEAEVRDKEFKYMSDLEIKSIEIELKEIKE